MSGNKMVNHILISVIVLFFWGCSHSTVENLSSQDQFDIAHEFFQNGKYEKARRDFNSIAYSYSGSELAEDAMFYIAESYFLSEDYDLAMSEYEILIHRYSASEMVEGARWKIALCQFELSPKYQLDQAMTHRALESLEEFMEEFPDSEFAKSAAEKRLFLRNKLGKKIYQSGELYRKLEQWKSASVYFRQIIENYFDTDFYESAKLQLSNSLFMEAKPSEAKSVFNTIDFEMLSEAEQNYYEEMKELVYGKKDK